MNQRRAEHDELRRLMVEFVAILDSQYNFDHALLLRQRLLFAQCFSLHLAREQGELDDLSEVSVELVEKAKMRLGMLCQLRSDYSMHVCSWTPAAILAKRSEYRSAVLNLQRRLTRFMAWEEQNLPIYL